MLRNPVLTLHRAYPTLLIGQVFNLLGRDNLGGLSSSYVTNVADAFGRILAALPRQQGEVALRFIF